MSEEFKNNLSENDDFIIENGFQLATEEEEVGKKRKKKKSKAKKSNSFAKNIAWILSIIIVAAGLGIGIIYAGADFTGIGFGRGADTTMDIKMGTPAAEISEQLKDSGAVKIPMLFRVYAKLKGYDSQFKYGFYTFSTEAGYEDLCQMLISEGAKAATVEVTIPEGTGINDFTKNVNGEKVTVPGITTLLEKAGVCSRADFLEALENVKRDTKLLQNADDIRTYHTLEGYLFPETYSFYSFDDKQECARLAVEKMLSESEKRITEDMYKRAEEMGYSMNEILTMASIIQMEAGIEIESEEAKARLIENMQGVAGVFYNRLNSSDFPSLGSSPTLFYGDSFKQDDGRYNTQADNKFSAIEGLPPGPLCSPGIDAINAALNPKESDYYYFVTDSSGNFYFHKTAAEQSATITKLQQGQQWVYEYFN